MISKAPAPSGDLSFLELVMNASFLVQVVMFLLLCVYRPDSSHTGKGSPDKKCHDQHNQASHIHFPTSFLISFP